MNPMGARGTAKARMSLVGNPSDNAEGAVLAVTIADFTAEAQVAEGPGDDAEIQAVIVAAVRAFPGPDSTGVHVRCETSIPRQVGLGGSSAIVVATMRALAAHHVVTLEPDELAAAAHATERDVLGIACGPQDRYAQAHEGLLLMDFADGAHVKRLDPAALPPLFLAFVRAGAEPSGVTHAQLGTRVGEDEVEEAMAELADLARIAGRALEGGDGQALGPLMDATFDRRARMLSLDPGHVRLVETARAHGAAANYTGSGGAIVGTVPHEDAWRALSGELEAQGCAVLRPVPAG